jgi:hypothetical protein
MSKKSLSSNHTVAMGVWQGVNLNCLKFHLGPPCPMAVSRVAGLQGAQPAAIFYPLGHPMPYAYVSCISFSHRQEPSQDQGLWEVVVPPPPQVVAMIRQTLNG